MDKGNGLHILLADDERAVRHVYKTQLLRHLGETGLSNTTRLDIELFDEPVEVETTTPASLTVCGQGAEAVELTTRAIAEGDPFDIIILDVRMPPGIDGVEAAVLIRGLDSMVPIIFLSGYSDRSRQEIDRRVPPPHRVWFVTKPIRMAQLAEKILEVAASRAAGHADGARANG